MKNLWVKTLIVGVVAASLIALAGQWNLGAREVDAIASPATGQLEANKGTGPGGPNALEGSWTATVTFRVCQTGAAIRSFPSMNSFEKGGTMHEFGLGNAPLPRGPGYGVWSHLGERRFYSMFQFFRFNADGTPAGSVRARRYMEVDFLGNTYSATTTTEIYDNNGALVMSGCATESAVRFE